MITLPTVRQLKLVEAMARLNFSVMETVRKSGLSVDQIRWMRRTQDLPFRDTRKQGQRHHPAIADLLRYHHGR